MAEALTKLLSQHALNIEINRTDDIEGLIQSIIQANKNLEESTQSNNWELIGSDLNELQSLIETLEKIMKEEKKSKEDQEGTRNQDTTTIQTQSLDENTSSNE